MTNWPLDLNREEAARYVGIGTSLFDREVAAGMWPAPVRRGEKRGRKTWYRPAIEKAAEELSKGGAL
ncbi:MAG: hypothetical protein ACLQJR_21540 [Stellaceae bacterium]